MALALVLAGALASGVGQDADTGWILADAAVLLVAVAVLLLAFAALRPRHARTAAMRTWAAVNAATLLVIALFVAID